jgi:uncharacterized protein
MRTRSKLIVDVLELLENPGSQKELRFSETLDELGLELARVPTNRPVSLDLTADSTEDGIVVRGQVAGRYIIVCRRCLTEQERDFSFEAAEVYRPRRDAWEEGYVIADGQIDLRFLVRDNVLINLPLHPTCTENCAGLCPRCGANLNDEACSCPREEGDIRWGALRDLLEQMGPDEPGR